MTDPVPRPPPGGAWRKRVAPVARSAAAARATYDRLARVYDLLEALFERRARAAGLQLLASRPGEHILEVGPGTGHALAAIAGQVGPHGRVVAVDVSARMVARTRRRVERAGHGQRAVVVQGDARRLPIRGDSVDAVTMSFVLDLIDTDEIAPVLRECRRVLRARGRLVVVALHLDDPPAAAARLYLRAHRRFPRLLDCRPIPVAAVLADNGWQVHTTRHLSSWGLPISATLARLKA